MVVLALDFAPGYKRKVGAIVFVASAAGVAYNNFVAAPFGLPHVPANFLTAANLAGNAVLGIGVAAASVWPRPPASARA